MKPREKWKITELYKSEYMKVDIYKFLGIIMLFPSHKIYITLNISSSILS